jgi:ribosomal protein S18 acetylase RimI-like enzyme
MPTNPASSVQIVVPTGDASQEAARLALRHLSPADREQAIAAGNAPVIAEPGNATTSDPAASEVLAARRKDVLVGALWVQQHPGRTASVCPPQLVDGEPEPTATALLNAAAARLMTRGVVLLQTLLETDTGSDFGRLQSADFRHVCDLLYLVSLVKSFPTAPPAAEFEFLPVRSGDDERRLAGLLEQTYQETLDCPQLNGVRSTADTLAGYRAGGAHAPERWLICRRDGRDVGCLLLGDHPAGNQWELVYMGLVPDARGRGWGASLTRQAQWLCRRAGRARLVLAVDASNGPAINAYAEAGFLAWDRRSVLLRVLTSGGDLGPAAL